MKPYFFHPDALEEAEHAVGFYEKRQQGLGMRFVETLEDAIRRIQRNPRLYKNVSGNIRKCRLLRFPYGVIFREVDERIEIIAVMHLKRQPGYWASRLG